MSRYVVLLRHGETPHSSDGRYSGRVDYPLSERGREQARRWEPLLAPYADAVTAFTSPLSRASDTAALAGFADAKPDDRLLEWDLGMLEGLRSEDYRRDHPEWNLVLDGPPEGTGEPVARVRERAREIGEVLAGAEGDVALAVSHGQFLRVLAVELLGLVPSSAGALSLGAGRAVVLSRRARGLSLTGWNLGPRPDLTGLLSDLT